MIGLVHQVANETGLDVPLSSIAGHCEDTWQRSCLGRRSADLTMGSRREFLTGLVSQISPSKGSTGGRRVARWRSTPTGPAGSQTLPASGVSGRLTTLYMAGTTWTAPGLVMTSTVRYMRSVKLTGRPGRSNVDLTSCFYFIF